MRRALAICLLACATLAAQVPTPGELSGKPLTIKKTWTVGGEGNWDYLTLDPMRLQLFVAHGPVAQVVDVETGAVAGQITGMRDAHEIALDDTGEFGYISDGPSAQVRVFDRRTLQSVTTITTAPSPRALVFEPLSKLLFVVGAEPAGQNPAETQPQPNPTQTRRSTSGASRPGSTTPRQPPRSAVNEKIKSTVTVIDPETREELAEILFLGKLGFAQIDSNGQVYIAVTDRNQILRLDAQAVGSLIRRLLGRPESPQSSAAITMLDHPLPLDWSGDGHQPLPADAHPRLFSLGPDCREPHGLAVDSRHLRLFVACVNQKMAVLNSETGDPIAALPTGPGTEAIGYDPERGLIYTANGGGDGSLSVVRQHVTDTYSLIQELPTRQRARTLAVNSVNGEVYLVTDIYGVDLPKKPGIGTLKMVPVGGTFQVLVIGN
jgi:DNA-binding beta-propeller fold protein YncE